MSPEAGKTAVRRGPKSRRRQRPTSERRLEVLAAARKLFFERGYRGTTIQQIATAAGYSKRTVYLDFRNKDELFMTVCAEGGELLVEQLQAIEADGLSVAQRMERFVDVYLEFAQQHGGYFRMIFAEATPAIIANCSADLGAHVAELERVGLGILVDWSQRAIDQGLIAPCDPWEVVGLFVGAATGLILLAMGGSQTVFSTHSTETLVRRAIQTLWRGLQAESTLPRQEA